MNNKNDLCGNLDFLNLADLIQLIGSNGAGGILRIIGNYSQHAGMVYFENGNPINAENGELKGIDALNSLFGWTSGEFEFVRQAVTIPKDINKSRMQIIMDGTRMLDDGLIEKLGSATYDEKPSFHSLETKGGPLIRGPLIDYLYIVDEEEFESGEEIVVEGKHGNWIWVILEGVVQIARDTSKGRCNLFRLTNGAFVGSVASFLIEGNIRDSAAIAVNKVQLGILDSHRLFVEFSKLSPELRSLFLSLDRRLKQLTDKTVSCFLNPKEADQSFLDKKILIRRGDPEKRLFKISQGHAFVARKPDSQEMAFIRLEPGDFIGSVPFISMGLEPETASIYVSKDIELTDLNPNLLHREFEQMPTTLKNIIENLSNSISATALILEKQYHQN